MRSARLLFVLTGLIWSGGVSAEIQPSFLLDVCAWRASDIVVVTEGETIDGNVEILESWKGKLRPGERITVAELAAFAPETERAVSNSWLRNDETEPAPVTCSRMVLFLMRAQGEGARIVWLPADRFSSQMRVSMAWIERGNVFAFAQEANPGPSQLTSADMSEGQLEQAVSHIVIVQRRFTEAIRSSDGSRLRSVVLPLLRVESVQVGRFIIAGMGDAGRESVPVIRAILDEDSLSHHHEDALTAFAKAGGADAAPDITEILKQELAFWQAVGASLSVNWWNDERVSPEELNRVRSHYGRTYAAVRALQGMRFSGSREVVTELRELWRSLPQLRRFDQVERECDQLLAGLEPQTVR